MIFRHYITPEEAIGICIIVTILMLVAVFLWALFQGGKDGGRYSPSYRKKFQYIPNRTMNIPQEITESSISNKENYHDIDNESEINTSIQQDSDKSNIIFLPPNVFKEFYNEFSLHTLIRKNSGKIEYNCKKKTNEIIELIKGIPVKGREKFWKVFKETIGLGLYSFNLRPYNVFKINNNKNRVHFFCRRSNKTQIGYNLDANTFIILKEKIIQNCTFEDISYDFVNFFTIFLGLFKSENVSTELKKFLGRVYMDYQGITKRKNFILPNK